MAELINLFFLTGHSVILMGVTLACCAAGVLLFRLISNRLAGFIYKVGR